MEEQRRLIVTNLTIKAQACLVCGLFQGNRLVEVQLQPASPDGDTNSGTVGESILGNIYVGRVKDVVKNLNAAFVEIAPGVPCYLSLKDVKSPVYVKKINSPRLVQGDQLLVQVEQEAIKTKPPRVTTNLTFHGKYLVLSTQEEAVGASKKLPEALREQLKELLREQRRTAFGVIARTACQKLLTGEQTTDSVSEPVKDQIQEVLAETQLQEILLKELWQLEQEAMELIAKAPYHTCFSCLRHQKPFYLQMLEQLSQETIDEIVTDQKAVYEELENYLDEARERQREGGQNGQQRDSRLRFYEDALLPLSKCASLEQRLSEALKKRVWLKSGGYLVIEPTEALTVIDVNSGKSISKKDPQQHYKKVNLEAAGEIAHQLRLRNLSGIILIDFIDLRSKGDQEELMQYMKELTKSDPVQVQVVDYTKLNLMELTRKKVRKSLSQQIEGGFTHD